jgi:hypothetical protein
VIPPPWPTVSRAPAAPTPPSFAPRAAPAPRPPLPGLHWPLLASPRRAAAARASTRAAGLPAAAPACPCLLLDLKHVLELPTNSLLPSRAWISTAFLSPELHTSPEHRRCLGSWSTTTAAASHPRSNTPAASPPPTDAHKPTQFQSPMLDRPDHYAGELELPPPSGLAVVPPLRRLLAPDRHTTSTISSRGSCLATSPPLMPSGHWNAAAVPQSIAAHPCSLSISRHSPSLPQHRPPP